MKPATTPEALAERAAALLTEACLESEARAFWRGVCASRAMLADELADRARSNARLYLELARTSAGYDDDAREHEKHAAWLRACAEAT